MCVTVLAQPIKLPRLGDRIGDGARAVDEDRVRRNGGQYRLCNKVSGRLQSEAFGVGRAAQSTFEPSRPIVSRGGLTGKEILNTRPLLSGATRRLSTLAAATRRPGRTPRRH